MSGTLSQNTKGLSQLDIEGGGQIVVHDGYAYIGHMKHPHGTSIVDISDPRKPRVVARLESGPWSHTHKVRVCGDIMITNVEQDRRHYLRREIQRLDDSRKTLTISSGREPEASELADALGINLDDLSDIEAALERGYDEGGFKVWDISAVPSAYPWFWRPSFRHGSALCLYIDRDARLHWQYPGYL